MSVMQRLLENLHVFLGLTPNEDAFSGSVYSKAARVEQYGLLSWLVGRGAGGTGTATITVEACSASDGTGATAVPFQKAAMASANSADTWGAYSDVTAAGFTFSATAQQLALIHVDKKDLPADKPWVRVKSVEVVDSPVKGFIVGIFANPQFYENPPKTVFS